MNRRDLTPGEAAILALVKEHYGPQNTEDTVMFSDSGDAVIWAKTEDGSTPVVVDLTNLAAWVADGTIANEEELLREWLQVTDVS